MVPETAMLRPETQGSIRTALVTRFSKNMAEVALDGEIRPALRTTGCGVDPRPGDRVVLFFSESEVPLILGIVEEAASAQPSPRTMRFPEGLIMDVSGRPFSVRSSEGIEVDTPEMNLLTGRLRGTFSECEIVSRKMTITGEILSFVGEKIREVARSIERVSEWFHDRAHGSIREIDTLDRHVSGETMIESESIVSIQSKTALISTEELVKIDSDQIHLG